MNQNTDAQLTLHVAAADEAIFAMSTTDYDVFVFDPANRPIDPKHVMELKRSIEKRNMLRSYPIVISSENGSWVVRDGQHRLMAARELGVPIYYTFNNEMTTEDVAGINGPQKSWTMLDYLHHYRVRGFPEYIKLQDFLNKYNWLSLAVAMELCMYGDRMRQNFKGGGYICNDLEFAEQVAQGVLQLSRWVSFYREAVFIQAVGQLFEHEGYNHQRMLRKMEFLSVRLVKCVNVEEYMKVFNAIYNHQEREGNWLQITKLNSGSKARREDRRNRNGKTSNSEVHP